MNKNKGEEKAIKDISLQNKPNFKNRIPEETEKLLIKYTIEHPTFGPLRVSNESRKQGILINQFTIRSVWKRNNLETKVAQEGLILTKSS